MRNGTTVIPDNGSVPSDTTVNAVITYDAGEIEANDVFWLYIYVDPSCASPFDPVSVSALSDTRTEAMTFPLWRHDPAIRCWISGSSGPTNSVPYWAAPRAATTA